MASISGAVMAACIMYMLMFLWLANSVSSISSGEFDSMLESLRVRGYNLFCNAIVTSDLQFDLLSDSYHNHTQEQEQEQEHQTTTNNSFTFFAPTDASLFALDMTQTASSYTNTLRYHVVPRRLSLPQLRLLPDGYSLPTLLPDRRLQLTRHPLSTLIAVGGVDIAFPGLFYGRDVAVHGLFGILSLRSNAVTEPASNNPPLPSPTPEVPPIRSPDRRHFSPRISPSTPENQTVLGPRPPPIPKLVSFNVTGRRGSPPPVEAPAPGPTPVTRQAPAASPVNGTAYAPEPDSMVHPPADSPPRFPDSAISSPPVGYSEVAVPAPVGLDLWVGKKDRVSLMETLTVTGDPNSPEKSEALDGIKNCVTSEDYVGHMQCYAA